MELTLSQLRSVPHDVRLFSDRRLHPNDAGFALYSQRLIEMLESAGVM